MKQHKLVILFLNHISCTTGRLMYYSEADVGRPAMRKRQAQGVELNDELGYERVGSMEMARRHRGSGAGHDDPKDAEDRASRWPRGGGEVMNPKKMTVVLVTICIIN
jgi:hypothetical protein